MSPVGAAVGSRLDLPDPQMSALLAAGAVAGLGGTFSLVTLPSKTSQAKIIPPSGASNVPPLAIACLISTALSRRASEGSIYTIGLLDRGVEIDSRRLF